MIGISKEELDRIEERRCIRDKVDSDHHIVRFGRLADAFASLGGKMKRMYKEALKEVDITVDGYRGSEEEGKVFESLLTHRVKEFKRIVKIYNEELAYKNTLQKLVKAIDNKYSCHFGYWSKF